MQGFSIKLAATAAGYHGGGRYSIDQLIARDHFVPRHHPVPPEPRQFPVDDIVKLSAIRRLMSAGVPARDAGFACRDADSSLYAFPDCERHFLVLWKGLHRPALDTTAEVLPDGTYKPTKPIPFGTSAAPGYGNDFVDHQELDRLRDSLTVDFYLVVNLKAVWASVRAELERLTGEPVD